MTQPKSKSKPPEETGANPPTSTLEEATEAGYLGYHPDQEPNASYTVEGVTEAPPQPPPDEEG